MHEDGRAGDPEVEFGGEAGGQEEFHLLQVNMDPYVQLQPDQQLPLLWKEDNQAVRDAGVVVLLWLWCCEVWFGVSGGVSVVK